MAGKTPLKNLLWLVLSLSFISCSPKRYMLPEGYENWPQFAPNQPLERLDSDLSERIGNIPQSTLLLWSVFDRRDYTEYLPTEEEKLLLMTEISNLSPLHQKVLNRYCVGIYFLEDFWGTGAADLILDEDGNPFVYLVFNPIAFHTNLNDWWAWKENTAFVPEEGFELYANLMDSENALSVIVAHEATHAVDYIYRITPFAEPGYGKGSAGIKKGAFTNEIWASYSKIASPFSDEREDSIHFYGFGGEPPFLISEAASLYEWMMTTPMVSLYGSQNWAEDLAEFYAFYYLTEVLGGDYEIVLEHDHEILETFRPMEAELVRNRFDFIEKVFY